MGYMGQQHMFNISQVKIVLKQSDSSGKDPSKVLLVQLLDGSLETTRKVSQASELGQSGKSAEAMSILQILQKANKIQLQEMKDDSEMEI
jgi:hypothetical protein